VLNVDTSDVDRARVPFCRCSTCIFWGVVSIERTSRGIQRVQRKSSLLIPDPSP